MVKGFTVLAVLGCAWFYNKLPLTPEQRFTATMVNHSTIAEVPIGKDTLFTDSLYGDLFLKEPIKKH
ncbi:MAG: hypothetical protein NC548_54790, partial [Lachnospiraceae bacterium]|nr:hypothetical protein [Lachnospiraceae bacterium]